MPFAQMPPTRMVHLMRTGGAENRIVALVVRLYQGGDNGAQLVEAIRMRRRCHTPKTLCKRSTLAKYKTNIAAIMPSFCSHFPRSAFSHRCPRPCRATLTVATRLGAPAHRDVQERSHLHAFEPGTMNAHGTHTAVLSHCPSSQACRVSVIAPSRCGSLLRKQHRP